MPRLVSRRTIIASLAASAALPQVLDAGAPRTSVRPKARGGTPATAAPAAAPTAERVQNAQSGAEQLVKGSGLSGEVGVAVADARTGLMLETYNADAGLAPASVAKVLTSVYALDTLGPAYRFPTQLLTDGTLSNGRLDGDLILAGGGDPTLDTDALADMAAKLKAAGVREVRGRFLVYDGYLPYERSIDEGQPEHVGYSPAVSGIALNFNRVHFEWRRQSNGYGVAMDARSGRHRPEVTTATMQLVNRATPIYTYNRKGATDEWTVAVQALGGAGSRWLPVRNPGEYAGDVFRTFARAQGIVLKEPETIRRFSGRVEVLVTHLSAPLRDLLRDMLKFSNNLMAEMIGLTASTVRGSRPRSLKDSGRDMSRWAAKTYGMNDTLYVDHSGLGPDSRTTAKDMVTLLVRVYPKNQLRPLLKPIAMRDSSGNTARNHPATVDAKTGTLNFVSGLGGYITTRDGTVLAFAYFSADMDIRSRLTKAQRDRPPGGRNWNYRSKALQQKMITRWEKLYGS
ncbi:D-alanyl-D-alanine carboxypeptidase/D-alanyl-D-alanine-endopeptidase [Chachezhania antarctica]|uniref:D-alanyl-D-alanine carboxypeptidase/D-alanyl-D-alanine endopeptidase n=1 Tax=Chachezhania antarctica TaxID=2340860 RepID=UPI000EB2814F|nr:D-alanyl-D-alanine carboxypeptidase/D-alanyl-D-alanine-endopeptidase [Chachezhania antarctica]|tara:strand:+ start:10141 stop:11679 length:1539 start_codon:yes stop_codon:yes gene_type:complete